MIPDFNKDENAHRYAVRGKKIERERQRQREKAREREIETPSETHSGDGSHSGGHKIITRNNDLVYYHTKLNNLQRNCVSKNINYNLN